MESKSIRDSTVRMSNTNSTRKGSASAFMSNNRASSPDQKIIKSNSNNTPSLSTMAKSKAMDAFRCNAREWFENLPSGKERAVALTITDVSFIKLFLGIVCKSEMLEGGMQPLNNSNGSLLNMRDLDSKYLKDLTDVCDAHRTDSLSNKQMDNNEAIASNLSKAATITNRKNDKAVETPPKKEIQSTAFRIRPETEEQRKTEFNRGDGYQLLPYSQSQDEPDFGEHHKRPSGTTLHFDSGLTLPITNVAGSNEDITVNPMKILEMNSLSQMPKLDVVDDWRKDKNDVHQKLNFSALDISSTSSPTHQTNRKEEEIISRSKLSFTPTMKTTRKEHNRALPEFFKHIRIVFTSARRIVEDSPVDRIYDDNDGIEALTLDPCYLEVVSRAVLKFYDDAQTFIDYERKKVERARQGDNAIDFKRSCLFLAHEPALENSGAINEISCPRWYLPLIEFEDLSVNFLLIFLAKMEVSIRDSYNEYTKRFEGLNNRHLECSNDYSSSSRKADDVATPPLSPGAKQILKLHHVTAATQVGIECSESNSSNENFFTPNEVEQIGASRSLHEVKGSLELGEKVLSLDSLCREKLPLSIISSPKCNESTMRCYRDILDAWLQLHSNSNKEFTMPLISCIRALFGSQVFINNVDFHAEDLVLVPLSFALSSASKHPFQEIQNTEQLTRKWNKIILSGIDYLNRSISSNGTQQSSSSDGIDEKKTEGTVEQNICHNLSTLFNTESLQVPTGKTKKKKRKKRKKKRKSASSCNTIVSNGDISIATKGKNESPKQSSMPKDENKFRQRAIIPEKNDGTSAVIRTETSLLNNTSTDELIESKTEETKNATVPRTSSSNITTLKTDITMSRVNGVHGTCVVGGGRVEEDENSDAWETVEPKGGRANCRNRKNSSDSFAQNGVLPGHTRKSKAKTKGASRHRMSQRRRGKDSSVVKDTSAQMKDSVEETEHCILDSVGEEIEKGIETAKTKRNDIKFRSNGDVLKRSDALPSGRNTRTTSLRDVVVRNIPCKTKTRRSFSHPTPSSISVTKTKNKKFSRAKESDRKLKPQKKRSVLVADQNTASTVPETLSGLSAATLSTLNTDDVESHTMKREKYLRKAAILRNRSKTFVSGSDCCDDNFSVTSVEEEKGAIRSSKNLRKYPTPQIQTPIDTLDTGSAKSSVASSLEEHREDDVGYHLLKSCEKLSEDMNSFMQRRSLALNVKRHERNLLLTALQDTLQSIWAGQCRPEVYGSCATKLDLPSSDLDIVICGLDRVAKENNVSDKNTQTSELNNEVYETDVNTNMTDDSIDSLANHSGNISNFSHCNSYQGHHQFYPPLSKNGMRVLRLAQELEIQPWAVQVKAIPTASVPVIKILADPSRLSDASGSMDWMTRHQNMAAVATTVAAKNQSIDCIVEQKDVDKSIDPNIGQNKYLHATSNHLATMAVLPSPPNLTAPQPWRGHDVMNGLLSLDITFEGPEHGGVGSTEYSNHVVEEACREINQSPESTPTVQVLVIIKELLAQRRLNEPFSGGLSSYAILLLVVSIIKERRIIREKMKSVERQRKAVSSECGNAVSVIPAQKNQNKYNTVVWPTPQQQSSSNMEPPIKRTPSEANKRERTFSISETRTAPKVDGWSQRNVQIKRESSWAAIAKKSPRSQNATERTPLQSQDNEENGGKNDFDSGGADFCSAKKNRNVSSIIKVDDDYTLRQSAEATADQSNERVSPLFPQGSNDVVEVLCSGEPTAGKLLMHFLLFYGRLFDSQTTCIDVRGTHHPDFVHHQSKNVDEISRSLFLHHLSPFVPRKAGGFINPSTEVYTVDPLVVYDPWEGKELNKNVSRTCFAWSSVRCVFEQCFDTLSGVVERGSGSGSDINDCRKNNNGQSNSRMTPIAGSRRGISRNGLNKRHQTDVSPLLELLLSF